MDNYIKAIEDCLALARRCLPLFNNNVELKLPLEDEILNFEQLRNKILHARLAAAPQPPAVVPVVPHPPTVVPVDPLSSSVVPSPPPLHTIAAAPSANATATTGTVIASTSTFAATIQASQKYPQYILI